MLCAVFLFSAAAFARPRQDRGNEGAVNVVTTVFPSYDFVREIAGDKVNLRLLLPPGLESHSFEPTPRDIIQIQNSDIFVYVGGESEAWVERILDSIDSSSARASSSRTGPRRVVSLMDMVEVVEEEIVEGMQEEDEEPGGEEEPEYDEHVWTSPRNAKLIVRALTETLCQADSANAAFYRENAKNYEAKLEDLDAGFREALAGAKRRTLIFGDRFPFRYFADAYGLRYYAAFPGCSTETECSAATLAFLIDKVRDEGIPVVFHIELSNEKIADAISESTGAKKLLFHACHNVSKQDMDRNVSYLELQRGNLERLREALY
ncbi:MAG: metal ABC transporter substrate-binding protein [Treponema sp.]|nr:metal ABC transporter substrate-binding protein [Treponema sp.]